MPAMVGTAEVNRARLLTISAEIMIGMEGEPCEVLYVTIIGIIRERKTTVNFESERGEPALLLGWGVRLDKEDFDILEVLADAEEPLQCRAIARELKMDPESSTLRLRVATKARLRTGGFISHINNDGYVITEKGRNALENR